MLKLKDLNLAMDHKKALTTHMVELKKKLDNGELTEQEVLNKRGKLVIFTQSTMIEGQVNLFDQESKKPTFFEYGLEDLEGGLDDLPPEMTAFNVSGPIHIKHAIIKSLTNGETTMLDEMILFSDQIMGLGFKGIT